MKFAGVVVRDSKQKGRRSGINDYKTLTSKVEKSLNKTFKNLKNRLCIVDKRSKVG